VAFDPRPVEAALLARCFEAARWAPSSFNEQPWRFLVGDRHADPAGWQRLHDVLAPSNQAWCAQVPVLVLSAARTTFTRNDKPNRAHAHDVGQAMACLVLQATALGLATHQMAGFDVERARAACAIPAPFEAQFMLALGWPGDGTALPADVRARDGGERRRRPQAEFVFPGAQWPAGR
jgi:nitroreductase